MDHHLVNLWMQLSAALLLFGSSWLIFFKLRRLVTVGLVASATGFAIALGLRVGVEWGVQQMGLLKMVPHDIHLLRGFCMVLESTSLCAFAILAAMNFSILQKRNYRV